MPGEKRTRDEWLAGLIRELPLSSRSTAHPAIWGGEFEHARLNDFLQAWAGLGLDMPLRIAEWISDLAFERDAPWLPPNAEYLEALRVFGPGGDLMLRRFAALPSAREAPFGADRWQWRFVGPEGAHLPKDFASVTEAELFAKPQPPFRAVDYWAETGCAGLQREARQVALWGALRYHMEGDRRVISWHEDRVAAAHLDYPGDWQHAPKRVELQYDAYLQDGNVEAVWWTGLAESGEVER